MARLRPTRSSSSSRPDGDAAALINRVGALMLAAHDSMAEAAAQAVGRGAQAPAALVVLREFLEDATIQQLSGVIGLTHSATVRLVDRLVTDGYVLRQGGGRDGRTVAIRLTVTRRRLEFRARGEQVSGWMCRLCDLGACGRPEGRCPVAATPAAETS